MEVIDLGFDNLEPISIEEKTVNTAPSVNFGPGVAEDKALLEKFKTAALNPTRNNKEISGANFPPLYLS